MPPPAIYSGDDVVARANLFVVVKPTALRSSFSSAEATVDCPFSLVVDESKLIFELLESPAPGVRVEFRDLGLPIAGAFARRVVAHFHNENDPTEAGRAHDQIDFDWEAGFLLLPDFHGTLRFRSETISRTNIVLSGTYLPPLGAFGAWFDRFVGHRLAHATLVGMLRRLVSELEALWAKENAENVHVLIGLARDDAARIVEPT